MMTPHLLFLTALVGAPDPTACPAKDFACSARALAAAASDRTAPEDERLRNGLAAARAYLKLFQRTGEARDLCVAQRWVERLRKKPEHPLAPLVARSSAEIAAEMERAQVVCSAPQRTTPTSGTPPVVATAKPVARSADTAPTEVPLLESSQPLARSRGLPSADARGRSGAPRPVPRAPAPRLGSGLLVAGGVAFVAAGALGGAAGFARHERDVLVAEGRALAAETWTQGYTDPATEAELQALLGRVTTWHRVMIGAAITAGVVGSVAVALLASGIRRRVRGSARRVAFRSPGVLLDVRF